METTKQAQIPVINLGEKKSCGELLSSSAQKRSNYREKYNSYAVNCTVYQFLQDFAIAEINY